MIKLFNINWLALFSCLLLAVIVIPIDCVVSYLLLGNKRIMTRLEII